MDDLGIAATASALSRGATTEAVQTAVLKKALDIGAEHALALVEAAAEVGQAANPPHLGNSVDVFA